MGKKYSPRRVCLSRGSFIIELREKSFAHNTNLSIITAFQSESSFSTKRKRQKKKKKKKGELNYEISERLERRILCERGDEGKVGSVYAKPDEKTAKIAEIKKKERERETVRLFRTTHSDNSILGIFFSMSTTRSLIALYPRLRLPFSLSLSILSLCLSTEMLNYKNNERWFKLFILFNIKKTVVFITSNTVNVA